jgi:hypothetical protein
MFKTLNLKKIATTPKGVVRFMSILYYQNAQSPVFQVINIWVFPRLAAGVALSALLLVHASLWGSLLQSLTQNSPLQTVCFAQ